MAEKKPAKQKTNEVIISGYLKENTLELVTFDKGSVVRGNLIIAVDALNSICVHFNVSEKTYSGEDSKDFKALLDLLPEKTTSIANYLESNPENGFEEAIGAANKIWARGAFDEYTRLDNDREVQSIQIRGYSAGIKKPSQSGEYKPHASFTTKVYIEDLYPEVDSSEAETGRYVLIGLIQKSSQAMIRIPFVAPEKLTTPDGVVQIAEYIKANYKKGGTVFLDGELVNVRERIENEDADRSSGYFGSLNRKQYRTKIVNERIITGGSNVSLSEGMEGAFTKTEVKIGLAKRSEIIDSNTQKASTKTARPADFTTTNKEEDSIDITDDDLPF